jgi:hypothetical protein
MTYKPTSYHKNNAKDLGVKITPSKAKGKKLQVELPDGKIKQIGAKGYNDYQLFKKKEGNEVANAKRDNYRARHRCHNAKRYTAQHLACEILWADRKKGVLRGK